MCLPSPGHAPLLNFRPAQIQVPVYTRDKSGEVQGFDAAVDITADDIEGAAGALERLYQDLPDGQRAVVIQLLRQASQAAG